MPQGCLITCGTLMHIVNANKNDCQLYLTYSGNCVVTVIKSALSLVTLLSIMASTLNSVRMETADLLNSVSDVALLEAELLIERATGLNRTQQRTAPENFLTASQLDGLQTLRQRRINGEPLAYILEEAHFWTLKLTVTPAVLIPRPETELVVERALFHLAHSAARALDLGTGSGAIALAIATERPQTAVLACDVSADALAVARINKTRLQLNNVELLVSNWFSEVPQQKFDVIVSNPPYIGVDDPDVQPEVRAHEPHLALFAADGGLHSLHTLIQTSPKYLKNGGWLILEHGWQQAAKVRRLLESHGFDSVASHLDLSGHERVTEAQFSL